MTTETPPRPNTCVSRHMRASLKDHVLVKVADAPCSGVYADSSLLAYRLHRPGSRTSSTLIVFTPEGIVIMGDMCPNQNGAISCWGCDLRWFVGRLSEDYLCGKFLRVGWYAERAIQEIKSPDFHMREDADQDMLDGLDELVSGLERGDMDERQFYDEYTTLTHDHDDVPGCGHRPEDAALLYAIQQRFSELYHA